MLDSFAYETNRANKTAGTNRIVKPLYTFNNSILNQQCRPYTTSLGRTTNYYKYRNLENAEEELGQSCQEQMSSYVASKIKQITRKYNQEIAHEDPVNLNSTIFSVQSNTIMKSQPKNIRQMRICGLGFSNQLKVQQVLGQPYFVNAKQKLMRMVAKKKQSQLKYQTLQFRVKQIENQRLIRKRLKDKQFKNPQPITKNEWDKEWCNQATKQVARYRTRLSLKHRKNNSGVTINW